MTTGVSMSNMDDDSCNDITILWIVSHMQVISIENVLLLWPWQRSNWSGRCMQGSSSIDGSSVAIKIFWIQRWQSVPTSKVANVKT